MVREREDLRSRLDLSGSNNNGPVTEQKYQVRSFVLSFLVGWRVVEGRGATCTYVCGAGRGVGASAPHVPNRTKLNQPEQDLKEEYRLYRKQALAALREKDAALAALSNGSNPPSSSAAAASASTAGGAHNGVGSLEFGYLRALCEKFFSTESPEASGVRFV